MNIKNELEAMNERMFTDELLDKILAAHRNELLRAGNRARAAALGAAGAAARCVDERPAVFQQARENAGNQPGAVSGVNPPASPRSPDRRR